MSTASYIKEILILTELTSGWDGPGSLAISEQVVQNTFACLNGVVDVPFLEVTPEPNGTISIEWEILESRTNIHLQVGLTTASMYIREEGQETSYFNFKDIHVSPISVSKEVNPYL